ncbi:hypothetical protein TNCV_2936751 [Trichonephila clavipes]|nr:hypothetical protein TNCV_2936751 [Trichonephila clavipes]
MGFLTFSKIPGMSRILPTVTDIREKDLQLKEQASHTPISSCDQNQTHFTFYDEEHEVWTFEETDDFQQDLFSRNLPFRAIYHKIAKRNLIELKEFHVVPLPCRPDDSGRNFQHLL